MSQDLRKRCSRARVAHPRPAEPLETRRLLAATLNLLVTDTSDSASDTGSLRYAIAQANAAAADTVITFSPAVFTSSTAEQIELYSDDSPLALTNTHYTETIAGPSLSDLTIDYVPVAQSGDTPATNPILSVDAGVTAEVDGLQFGNGMAGVINNAGTLTLNRDVFSESADSAVGDDPAIQRSAVASTGRLTATSCDFDDNSAALTAAAVRATGPVSLTGCLFDGDTSTRDGGALQDAAPASDPPSTVQDCTFSGDLTPHRTPWL